jgi:hypothetical protein
MKYLLPLAALGRAMPVHYYFHEALLFTPFTLFYRKKVDAVHLSRMPPVGWQRLQQRNFHVHDDCKYDRGFRHKC